MITSVLIRDAAGERRVSVGSVPLRIGGGVEADLRLEALEGVDGAAFVGFAEGHAFVQPGLENVAVERNARPVTDSEWLADGDVLSIAGRQVRCTVDGTRLILTAEASGPVPALRPPPGPPPGGPRPVEPPGPPARAGAGPTHPRRVVHVMLAVAFGVLLVVAGFVFMATPVTVRVEPAPDWLAVEGFPPAVEVGGRYLMYPGRYTVRAERIGYRPLAEEVEVRSDDHQGIQLTLRKLPGLVTFTTRPEQGAEILVDGEPVGTTPVERLEVEPGTRRVTARSERYLEASAEIEVEGLGREQSMDLELTPRWAAVSFASSPAGAALLIDGEPAGETPLTLDLFAGRYQVEVRLEDHDPAEAELVVVANEPQQVPVFELRPSDGTLAVETRPAGATITVDGQFRGRSPLEVALRPGEAHQVRVAKPGYEPASRSVRVQSNRTESLSVQLTPRYGVVFFRATPADAELLVDGRPRGAAAQRLKLTAVPHRVEIRKEGYEPYVGTVTPRPGFSETLSVTLVTRAQAKARKVTDTRRTAAGQELRLVRPGRFVMGASRRESGRRANENLRRVELTRPFYLSVKEVTNAEFRQFKPGHSSGIHRGNDLNGDDRPVVNVTWDEAAAYLNWLSRKDGLKPAYEKRGENMVVIRPLTGGYRLPSEAEWAYAARIAGRAAPIKYPWGETFPPRTKSGNYADNSADRLLANTVPGYDDGYTVTAPVGSFPPDGLGFYDLGGNVAEWCNDYYTFYPDAGQDLARDPLGPETGKHRVVRGSSWQHGSISELRLSFRDYSSEARPDLGFRIARYAD